MEHQARACRTIRNCNCTIIHTPFHCQGHVASGDLDVYIHTATFRWFPQLTLHSEENFAYRTAFFSAAPFPYQKEEKTSKESQPSYYVPCFSSPAVCARATIGLPSNSLKPWAYFEWPEPVDLKFLQPRGWDCLGRHKIPKHSLTFYLGPKTAIQQLQLF